MRYVVQALGAIVGFVAAFLISGIVLGTIIWLTMSNSSTPPGGAIFSILASAATGLSFVGARSGWLLARRWAP